MKPMHLHIGDSQCLGCVAPNLDSQVFRSSLRLRKSSEPRDILFARKLDSDCPGVGTPGWNQQLLLLEMAFRQSECQLSSTFLSHCSWLE